MPTIVKSVEGKRIEKGEITKGFVAKCAHADPCTIKL